MKHASMEIYVLFGHAYVTFFPAKILFSTTTISRLVLILPDNGRFLPVDIFLFIFLPFFRKKQTSDILIFKLSQQVIKAPVLVLTSNYYPDKSAEMRYKRKTKSDWLKTFDCDVT